RVDVTPREHRSLLGVVDRHHVAQVALLEDRREVMTGRDVLGVAELRGRYTLARQIGERRDAAALAGHDDDAVRSGTGHDHDSLAGASFEGAERRPRPHVPNVDLAGEEGLDERRSRVEELRLELERRDGATEIAGSDAEDGL